MNDNKLNFIKNTYQYSTNTFTIFENAARFVFSGKRSLYLLPVLAASDPNYYSLVTESRSSYNTVGCFFIWNIDWSPVATCVRLSTILLGLFEGEHYKFMTKGQAKWRICNMHECRQLTTDNTVTMVTTTLRQHNGSQEMSQVWIVKLKIIYINWLDDNLSVYFILIILYF